MESVPLYLVVFCWKIRKGSLEDGYLRERFKKLEKMDVLDEVYMLRKLAEHHLVVLTEEEDELVLDPLETVAPNGVHYTMVGEELHVQIPKRFMTTARWRWLWSEYVTAAVKWLTIAVLGALIAKALD